MYKQLIKEEVLGSNLEHEVALKQATILLRHAPILLVAAYIKKKQL